MKTVKGTRDFLPSEQLIREDIMQSLRVVFQSFGFRPLDTPALELFETLSAKYAGGSEILKETFSLKGRSDTPLGLRYDLTVPLARVIASNPQLKFPFKRYQISKVWRDGPVGMGRYREFWQCDVDTIGAKSMKADAEILAIAYEVFKKLECKVVINVNNRKLLNGILEKLEISNTADAISIIDKFKKLNKKGLLKEFKAKGISSVTAEKILNFFEKIPTNALSFLSKEITSEEGQEGLQELKELSKYAKAYGIKVNITPELARGLSYYTSTIFEIFAPKFNFSLAGGGRYNKLIGSFLNAKQDYPAVGISFGLDRIRDILAEKTTKIETKTQIFIIPIGTELEAIVLTKKLREVGINVETDIMGKGITKNLNYANSLGIPYVLFLGEKEIKAGKYKLKNMTSGKETLITEKTLIKQLFSPDC